MPKKQRKSRGFLEMFAGLAGLTLAMSAILQGCVQVLPPGEIRKDLAWDLEDDGVVARVARQIEASVLWLLSAPPCRTFTKARRTDRHGTVPVLRSRKHPEGFGQAQVLRANLLAERAAALSELAWKQGADFSVENPVDSFLW